MTERGRPGAWEVQCLFAVYNGLVMAFAVAGLSQNLHRGRWAGSFALLLAVGLLGLLMWPVPMDPIGTGPTPSGILHIALAALMSLASIGAIGLSVLGWRSTPNGAGPALFSLLCLAMVVASGLLAAIAAVGGWPTMGLLERITIGAFLLWMAVTAVLLLLAHK